MAKGNRNGKMDPMHKMVADAYLADPELNQTRAYMSVYTDCAKDSARSAAARMFAIDSVSAYVQAKMQKREAKAEVTQDFVLRELAKIAGFDARDLFEADGSVKLVKDWNDSVGASIASFDVAEIFDGKGDQKQAVGLSKKAYTRDKIKALELLGKHLGMFKDRTVLENPDGSALTPPRIEIVLVKPDTK